MSYNHEYLHNVTIDDDEKATLYSNLFGMRPMNISGAQALVVDADNLALTAIRVNDAINAINALQGNKTNTELQLANMLKRLGTTPTPYDSAATYNIGNVVTIDDGYLYICAQDNVSGIAPESDDTYWIRAIQTTLGANLLEDVDVTHYVGGDIYNIDGQEGIRVNNALMAEDAYPSILNDTVYYSIDDNILTFKYKDADGEEDILYPRIAPANIVVSEGRFAGRKLSDVLENVFTIKR